MIDPRFVPITPSAFHALMGESSEGVEVYRARANAPERTCSVCRAHPVWRLSGLGDMCFHCITGEADPSDDYELVPEGSSHD